jgi:hypothetical protein
MHLAVVLSVYAAVGAFVTAYTFYHEVVLRPRHTLVTFTDQVILSLASAATGLAWVLFVPGLAIVFSRIVSRSWQASHKGLSLQRTEQVRARS